MSTFNIKFIILKSWSINFIIRFVPSRCLYEIINCKRPWSFKNWASSSTTKITKKKAKMLLITGNVVDYHKYWKLQWVVFIFQKGGFLCLKGQLSFLTYFKWLHIFIFYEDGQGRTVDERGPVQCIERKK